MRGYGTVSSSLVPNAKIRIRIRIFSIGVFFLGPAFAFYLLIYCISFLPE
jgi:Sec-independent protein secretion pathway component TatC